MEKSIDLVPPAAAARIRGVSRRTIWNWLYRGWIQRFTETGRTLVDLAEVKQFVLPKAGQQAQEAARYTITYNRYFPPRIAIR